MGAAKKAHFQNMKTDYDASMQELKAKGLKLKPAGAKKKPWSRQYWDIVQAQTSEPDIDKLKSGGKAWREHLKSVIVNTESE